MASPRRLVRSRRDRRLAGICGGLAQYFSVDATLVRVGFVLFGLFGVGELVYLVLWLVIPKEP